MISKLGLGRVYVKSEESRVSTAPMNAGLFLGEDDIPVSKKGKKTRWGKYGEDIEHLDVGDLCNKMQSIN